MTKVLTIPVHEDASIVAHILCIPAAEIGVEKGVRNPAQRLH
jgi:hypothetical protein